MSIGGIKVGFDLVDLVTSSDHDLVNQVNRKGANHVLKECLIEDGEKGFWDAIGPWPKPRTYATCQDHDLHYLRL